MSSFCPKPCHVHVHAGEMLSEWIEIRVVLFITFAVFQYFGLLVHQGGLDEWKSESSALCLSSGCPALSIKIFVFLVAALTYPLSFFPSCVHLCLLGHSCPLCLPFYLFANPPAFILAIFQSFRPLSVLWWGAGWPWIPLLLWGNNRPFLLLCTPLSPTWGPQSTGKKWARGTRTASRVCGREGEWESGVTTNKINYMLKCQINEHFLRVWHQYFWFLIDLSHSSSLHASLVLFHIFFRSN